VVRAGNCAIVGLGVTPSGRIPGRSGMSFALEAARNAVADAGLRPQDIDGMCWEECPTDSTLNTWTLADALGIGGQLGFTANFLSRGTSACNAVEAAVMAIEAGSATTVLCVFSDNSFSHTRGAYYQRPRGLAAAYGMFGAAPGYAMRAARHMALYGTTNDQLGEIAVSTRAYAARNPEAYYAGRPMSIEEYRASRWVAEPLHLYDCCMVSDGGRAVVVTSAERARDLKQRPILILGSGQGNEITQPGFVSGVDCAAKAFGSAGLTPAEIDFCELYDCFTITVLMQLEDFGFCAKGEGGPFVAEGRLRADGSLPTNTGGGLLSDVYLQGWTPLTEGIRQLRGDCGERQLERARIGFISGNSGTTESCLILAAG